MSQTFAWSEGRELPKTASAFMDWNWERIEPFYRDLQEVQLSAEALDDWLAGWTQLANLLHETFARLQVATAVNTADKEAEKKYMRFLDEIYPPSMDWDQKLKTKLLDSGLSPKNFDVQHRNMQSDAELFREANLPLLAEEQKCTLAFDSILGAQTVEWDGKEVTVSQLRPVFQSTDRGKREKAWRLGVGRQLADREAINDLWKKFMDIRKQLAANADYPSYRGYRWRQLHRFDYSPDDCERFRDAIAEVVVPAATRIYKKRKKQLGVESLRPWDLAVDPLGREALRPFADVQQLQDTAESIFQQVDSRFGDYFRIMRQEKLLDLDNRKNKAPGGFCIAFSVDERPFIFMNAVGLHDDVQTLLHEGGHAFHVFETAHLPYHQQKQVGMEFAEVASMSMELLTSPYLASDKGGFYSPDEAARALIEHLEGIILFWPYMAVVDGFQHWVYENHEAATDGANCDGTWAELWQRFMPEVDWSGLEAEMKTGWHRKLHIHQVPFYYVEYGMAQLGAVQVWQNSLTDRKNAVEAYRRALALGGTVSLPQLYKTAGAEFAFNVGVLHKAVAQIEETISELDKNRL